MSEEDNLVDESEEENKELKDETEEEENSEIHEIDEEKPENDEFNENKEGNISDQMDEIEKSGDNEEIDDEERIKRELMEFAEMDEFADLSDDDLLDIQEALEENKEEMAEFPIDEGNAEVLDTEVEETLQQEAEVEDVAEPMQMQEIDAELEAKMEAELAKKREEKAASEVSREQFIEYLSKKRTKIMYHALWYLAFNVDDHQASKQLLYEQLKNPTSKDPVEPLEEHKFYFGLGFILRLKYNKQNIVKFKSGKLKIVGIIKEVKEILRIVGDPISERPILTQKEKDKMFLDFLKDDFSDI